MKHLVISLLIFTSTSLLAQQWTPIATSVDGTVSNLDLATLRKEGDIRRVWVLENFSEKKPSMFLSDSSGVFSIRYRMEYDCKNERQKHFPTLFLLKKKLRAQSVQNLICPQIGLISRPELRHGNLWKQLVKQSYPNKYLPSEFKSSVTAIAAMKRICGGLSKIN